MKFEVLFFLNICENYSMISNKIFDFKRDPSQFWEFSELNKINSREVAGRMTHDNSFLKNIQ